MYKINPLLATDSYKLGHATMYPEGTELIYSNFTARSDKYLNYNVPRRYQTNKVVFFGLQAVLKEMNDLWDENFFKKHLSEIKHGDFLETIKPFMQGSKFPFENIVRLHQHGRLPITVQALPEGSRVNIGVPLFTIYNTRSEFYWITNYLETYLSNELWKMITVATIADRYKAMFMDYAERTGADKEFVQFQGHDFSMRGMSGTLDSVKCSAAHLTSFVGSDNLLSPSYLKYYYHTNDELVACSVPATEHSVMCIGTQDNEQETIRRIIQDIYPTGIVSVVSDSWDFFNVVSNIALKLKNTILERDGKVVFRPDSGDPVRIICGYRAKEISSSKELGYLDYHDGILVSSDSYYFEHDKCDAVLLDGKYFELDYDDENYLTIGKEISRQQVLGAIGCLWEIFGGTFTDLGYCTLNGKVGLIYGDSITLQRANDILEGLKQKGFSSDNIVFGIGSYTYQHITRDTLGFAIKATYGVVDGKSVNIIKNPVTDNGTKRSARGLLAVIKDGENFVPKDELTSTQYMFIDSELKRVYHSGHLETEVSLNDIRNKLK